MHLLTFVAAAWYTNLIHQSEASNMFDDLPALAPLKLTDLGSELTHYLATEVEHIADPITWWHECFGSYPHLSRMALDYLTISGKPFMQ